MRLRHRFLRPLLLLTALLSAPAVANIAPQAAIEKPRSAAVLQGLLAELESRDAVTLVRQTHAMFRGFAFMEDAATHGTRDYWTTLDEFLLQGGGDCEDFALAKYQVLADAGIPREQLRLAYSVDPRTLAKHMVLLYVPGDMTDALVLDNNQPDRLITLSDYAFDIAFSFTAEELTIHRASGFVTRRLGTEMNYARWSDWLQRSAKG